MDLFLCSNKSFQHVLCSDRDVRIQNVRRLKSICPIFWIDPKRDQINEGRGRQKASTGWNIPLSLTGSAALVSSQDPLFFKNVQAR